MITDINVIFTVFKSSIMDNRDIEIKKNIDANKLLINKISQKSEQIFLGGGEKNQTSA